MPWGARGGWGVLGAGGEGTRGRRWGGCVVGCGPRRRGVPRVGAGCQPAPLLVPQAHRTAPGADCDRPPLPPFSLPRARPQVSLSLPSASGPSGGANASAAGNDPSQHSTASLSNPSAPAPALHHQGCSDTDPCSCQAAVLAGTRSLHQSNSDNARSAPAGATAARVLATAGHSMHHAAPAGMGNSTILSQASSRSVWLDAADGQASAGAALLRLSTPNCDSNMEVLEPPVGGPGGGGTGTPVASAQCTFRVSACLGASMPTNA